MSQTVYDTSDTIIVLESMLAREKAARRQSLLANPAQAGVKWVALEKFREMTGLDARGRINRGEWPKNKIWRKLGDPKNGRIVVNLEVYNKWVEEGTQAFV